MQLTNVNFRYGLAINLHKVLFYLFRLYAIVGMKQHVLFFG